MRQILLDCGCHYGKGLRKLIELHQIKPSWNVYCWEANPYTYEHFLKIDRFKHLNLTAYNQAVSNQSGKIKFNVQSSTDRNGGSTKSGTGSSLMSLDQWHCQGGEFVEEVEINQIDLSQWMFDNLQETDAVILKMDIEGAEYQTLEKVISSEAIKFIDKLYIEWHSSMFINSEEYKVRENIILNEFLKNNIPVQDW